MYDMKDKMFAAKSVEFWKEQVKWNTEMIEQCNDMLKVLRDERKAVIKRLWDRGVLEKIEMEYVTSGDTRTRDERYYAKQRSYYYRMRAQDRRRADEAQAILEEIDKFL